MQVILLRLFVSQTEMSRGGGGHPGPNCPSTIFGVQAINKQGQTNKTYFVYYQVKNCPDFYNSLLDILFISEDERVDLKIELLDVYHGDVYQQVVG